MTTKLDPTTNAAKQRALRNPSAATAGTLVASAAGPTSRLVAIPAPATSNQPNRSATVLKLLGRAKGATIAEIAEPTGWQPHSTRAYLSGLRKKGLSVIREQRRTGETTYRIADAASVKAHAVVTLTVDAISPASSTGSEADGSTAKTDDARALASARFDTGSTPETTA